jgi:hypothetical protein
MSLFDKCTYQTVFDFLIYFLHQWYNLYYPCNTRRKHIQENTAAQQYNSSTVKRKGGHSVASALVNRLDMEKKRKIIAYQQYGKETYPNILKIW